MVFIGVITEVGGWVLRDMLAGQTPYIFVKHIYTCVSLTGAVVCVLLWKVLDGTLSMIVGAVAVVVLRLLAAHFRWNLLKSPLEEREC